MLIGLLSLNLICEKLHYVITLIGTIIVFICGHLPVNISKMAECNVIQVLCSDNNVNRLLSDLLQKDLLQEKIGHPSILHTMER